MDIFDDNGDDKSEGFQINEDFASHFDDEATRRTKQRWKEVASRFPLSAGYIKGLLVGAKTANAHKESKFTSRGIVEALMSDRGWVADDEATAILSRTGPPGSASVDAAALAQQCEDPALKKAIRAAFVFIKKVAHTAPEKAVKPKAASKAGQKRPRSSSSEKADIDGKDDDDEDGNAPAISPVKRSAADGAVIHASSLSSSSADVRLHRGGRVLKPPSSKKHGRGAGKGRGLDFRGEPKFDQMHPSWQAKRKAQRRQLKIVTKALRAGQAQEDAAIVVVEEGS